jgi:antitoxin MazE
MELSIITIGNSKGLRIPKVLLEKYGMQERVEVTLKEDHIELRSLKHPRQGWEMAFERMANNGDDQLLMPDFFEDEDFLTDEI